jgi:hypothetical protein
VNVDTVFPRFLQAQHNMLYGGSKPVGWTEGFSCQRAAAIEAGLFPEELSGAGGEDGEFVRRLIERYGPGIVDKTIEVPHVRPTTTREFWRQWHGRGRSTPQLERRVHKRSLVGTAGRRLLATALSVVQIALVIPIITYAVRMSGHSPRGLSDVCRFTFVRILQVTAHRSGEWIGLGSMVRADL